MSSTDPGVFLAYGASGFLYGVNGFQWPPGPFWHERCAYCSTPLKEEESHHMGFALIAQLPDTADGIGVCFSCGNRSAKYVSSVSRLLDGITVYQPRYQSPGRRCFMKIKTCRSCGWWYLLEHGHEAENAGDPPVMHGILKSFDMADASLPLDVLSTELPRHIDKIGQLHPNRMEDLVARVLRGVYDCEVRQLGYTRDGGIDLIVLRGDKDIAVQVKRRADASKTESVRGVREFLGAGLVAGFRHLLYVTTAGSFSKDATYFARSAVDLALIERFELIDLALLKAMLEMPVPETNWFAAIRKHISKGGSMAATADPYEIVAQTTIT